MANDKQEAISILWTTAANNSSDLLVILASISEIRRLDGNPWFF